MKNLLEEGFDVTGFDRNEYLGGLWHYDERARISVLESKLSTRLQQHLQPN
jgi:dimethylaniline monooxygenase (N-oxide forming)